MHWDDENEIGEGAWGGPLAQTDFAGGGVGFFGVDAVEDLLILQQGITD